VSFDLKTAFHVSNKETTLRPETANVKGERRSSWSENETSTNVYTAQQSRSCKKVYPFLPHLMR